MSVKNELKALKRKVAKRSYVPLSGLTPHELLERSNARIQRRLEALGAGSPLPSEDYLTHEHEDLEALLSPHSVGSLDILTNRLFDMARNRDEAERRQEEREQKRATTAAIMRDVAGPAEEPMHLSAKLLRSLGADRLGKKLHSETVEKDGGSLTDEIDAVANYLYGPKKGRIGIEPE
jgi:hypothetical protein